MIKTETINTQDVKTGDTLLVNGEMVTISRTNIPTVDDFYGWKFNGKYTKKVEVVLFPNWNNGKLKSYVRQV
jgi:hypothetical protein